ncbi:MAG: hypothetical protein ACR2PL_27770 [Dehalococcoidia bacterium]
MPGAPYRFRFGHVWVVLALWVPLPMSQQRGFALPILVRLSTGAKRGGTWDARSRPTTGKRLRVAEQAHAERDQRTKLERLRELVGLLAAWAVPRTTPAAIVVDDLVLLWFAAHGAAAGPAWVARPWSRRKATPSFLDMLTVVRHAGSQAPIVAPPFPARLPQKSRQPPVPK